MKMPMPGLDAVAAAETAFATFPAATLSADRWRTLAVRHAPEPDAQATSVVDFWREAGPARWFAKDAEFDRTFRYAFLPLHELAAVRALAAWPLTATGALALALLLDQFPRNAFRGTAPMYATDALAREAAASAMDAGHDRAVEEALRLYLLSSLRPFGGPRRPGAVGRACPASWRTGAVPCRGPSRDHPAVRPLPASQPDPRPRHDAGRAEISRRGRLRRLSGARLTAASRSKWRGGR